MMYAIETIGLSKNYGRVHAVDGVHLRVGPGEIYGFLGLNGAGKTTTIRALLGMIRPSAGEVRVPSGEVIVGGTAVNTLREGQIAVWRGHTIGVVFQFFQLLPTLTAIENVMLPMDFGKVYAPAQRYARAMHLLEQVGMAEHAHTLPLALSGGQQQSVAIARALANDPPLLAADEPTGNLDSKTAESVFRLFENLVDSGKTILMVTHDSDLAQRAQAHRRHGRWTKSYE